MANNSITIIELFHRVGATKDVDFLREGVSRAALPRSRQRFSPRRFFSQGEVPYGRSL